MNPVEEIKSALRSMIMSALEKAQAEQALSIEAVPDFVIEVPREKEHGDFACNVAMLLAKSVRRSPARLPGLLSTTWTKEAVLHLDRVMVAGAGFINMYLRPGWLYSIPALVIQMGEDC